MKIGIKCKECGAYKSHHPLCRNITSVEAKKQLVMYYRMWLSLEIQRREFKGKPIKIRDGYSCWVFCPICGKKG